jgi:hypothetical protein
MEFQKIYINLVQASTLVPIIAGIINYKALTKPYMVLFYFMIANVLFEIQALVAIEMFHNNLPGLYLFTFIEFLVFSTVFYLNTRKNSIARLLIIANVVVFIGIAVTEAVHNQMKIANDLSRGYSSACLIIYTLIYFFHLFTTDDIRYMREYPMFWICIAILIYFGPNVLYFMERSKLIKEYPSVEWGIDMFHGMLVIIANCLVAQSFICLKKYRAAAL